MEKHLVQAVPSAGNSVWRFSHILIGSLIVLSGCSWFGQVEDTPPSVEAPRAKISGEPSERVLAYAEILSEMYEVVLARKMSDRVEFGIWVDTLSQGASFEGIYNSFTHSADYRKMEQETPGANKKTLEIFATELARTQIGFSGATIYDPSASEPLPFPVQPGEGSSSGG